MDKFKKGDRLRVEFEAEVVEVDNDGDLWFAASNPIAQGLFSTTMQSLAQIERIEPPLKVGDRVHSNPGHRPGTVMGIDGEAAWVRHDAGAYQTFHLSDLERIA